LNDDSCRAPGVPLFSQEALDEATEVVRAVVSPTPAYCWPLLRKRTGVEIFVKHENHTPIGAFKVRGGLVYLDSLRRAGKLPTGVVTATRGNHGQSIALAAARNGIAAAVVVPQGNSVEKNAAMEAFGAELIVAGVDFDDSRAIAARIGEERGYHYVPSFHPQLVRGVATYAYELFRAVAGLAVVYVPIGMGSGICGLIAVRDLLKLDTEIVGVVADTAPAFALSVEAGHVVAGISSRTFADGMACRDPPVEAVAVVRHGAARVLRLGEAEIADAVRIFHSDTHNVAEGAGAAALAGLIRERRRYEGRRAAVICSGGNIDGPVLSHILSGGTP
jgi:threonine dehydratase